MASEVTVRSAGKLTHDGYMVSADQETIIGNGTARDPLRIRPPASSDPLPAGPTIRAAFRGGSVEATAGVPVFVAFVAGSGGATTVQVTDVRAQPLIDGTAGFASVAGVLATTNDDGTVQFQSSGPLTLSASRWDDVTGGDGGLRLGHVYYASTTTGRITDVPPSGPGQFVAQVGVALSATTLLVQPQASIQNLRDLLLFADAPQPLTLGMAVTIDGAGQARPAHRNVSVDQATAVGLVAAFDTNGGPILQLGGVVTLTEAQWDVVAEGLSGPGLRTGHAYYVDTDADAGHVTTEAPTQFAKVQVGIALSSTRMLLPGPFLQRLS